MQNNYSHRKNAKKIARLGMLIALAFVLSYLEALLSFTYAVPGIKIGFANIVIMSCIYILPFHEVIGVSVVRILLVSLTFGNLSMFLYSLTGALLSLIVMWLLKKSNRFSPVTVSICGGFAHNLGQIATAVLMLGKGLLYYLPFLMIGGISSGLLVGIIASSLIKFLKRHKNLLI